MSVTGRFAVLKAKRTGDGWDYYLINGTVANANPDFGQNLHSRGYFGDKVIFKARIPDGMQAEIVAFAPESTRGETTETWSIGGSVSCNAGAENGKPEGGCQVGVSFGFSSSYRIADVQSSGSSSNRSAQLISQLPAPKIGEREVKPVSRGGMSYPAGLIVRVREGQAAAIDLTLRAEYVYEWVWWREDDRVTPEVSARVVLGGQHMAFRGLAGRCMDVSGGVVRSGERLILWDCHKLGNQRWSYNERSQLVSSVGPRNSQGTQVAPFFCLDAGSGAQGSALTVSPCDERLSQKFRLHQNEIRSVLADQCVDVAGGNSDPGTPLILWPCHGNHNQRWQPEN